MVRGMLKYSARWLGEVVPLLIDRLVAAGHDAIKAYLTSRSEPARARPPPRHAKVRNLEKVYPILEVLSMASETSRGAPVPEEIRSKAPTAFVTPDGSPVPVYLALPLEPEFTPVLQAIRTGSSVLDLGCGVGRLANHLAAEGHRVVGVDESAEMLAHLAEAVDGLCAKIEGLRLSERFDAVVLASHFINVADVDQRHALMETAAHHLAPGGSLFVERYDPTWDPQVSAAREGASGPVRVSSQVLERTGDTFAARVTFKLGQDEWVQDFRARIVDDVALDGVLSGVGLAATRRLDERGWWIEAMRVDDLWTRGERD